MSSPTKDGVELVHVDDDPSIVQLTRDVLEDRFPQCRVSSTTSPEEALEMIKERDFDCVVADYDMPGMDGIELLRRVRQRFETLPFILFTGKGSEEVASRAISAGVTDYVKKVGGLSQYDVLMNRVENAIGHIETTREVERTKQILYELAEHSDDILYVVDSDWDELRFINSSYQEIWGGSIEELRDDPTSFLEYIHPDDRKIARDSMEALQRGEPSSVEYRIIDDDGNERKIRGDSKPIFDDQGNVERIAGYVRDIPIA